MYVFKHMESNQYLSGTGWYQKLTPDIKKARVFLEPNRAWPSARYNGVFLTAHQFTAVPIEIREARNLKDIGEDE